MNYTACFSTILRSFYASLLDFSNDLGTSTHSTVLFLQALFYCINLNMDLCRNTFWPSFLVTESSRISFLTHRWFTYLIHFTFCTCPYIPIMSALLVDMIFKQLKYPNYPFKDIGRIYYGLLSSIFVLLCMQLLRTLQVHLYIYISCLRHSRVISV